MVTVPADFDEELVWTLTTQGQTEHAYGTLGIDQVLDNIVIASETGALGIGASNAEIRANTPPVRKKRRVVYRYITPIRLWSRV